MLYDLRKVIELSSSRGRLLCEYRGPVYPVGYFLLSGMYGPILVNRLSACSSRVEYFSYVSYEGNCAMAL